MFFELGRFLPTDGKKIPGIQQKLSQSYAWSPPNFHCPDMLPPTVVHPRRSYHISKSYIELGNTRAVPTSAVRIELRGGRIPDARRFW